MMTRTQIFEFTRVLFNQSYAPWQNFEKALDDHGDVVDEKLMDETVDAFLENLRDEKKELVMSSLGREKITKIIQRIGIMSRARRVDKSDVTNIIKIITEIKGGGVTKAEGEENLMVSVKSNLMRRVVFCDWKVIEMGIECARAFYAIKSDRESFDLEKFIQRELDLLIEEIAPRINSTGQKLKDSYEAGETFEVTDSEIDAMEEDLWKVLVFTNEQNAQAALATLRAMYAMKCLHESGVMELQSKESFRAVHSFSV